MLSLFMIQMIFLSIGLFFGCEMKRYKLATSASVSLLLVTYFLALVTVFNKSLDFLKYFSPFKYFGPAVLLRQSRIDVALVGLSLAIIAASIVGAYLTYSRRDLYI